MKKMMIMTAVILCAAFSQASAIRWGLSVGSVKDPDTSVNMANAIVYLLYGSQDGVAASIANGTFTTTYGGASFVESKLTAAGGNILTAAYSSESLVSGTYNWFVVAFDASTVGAAGNYQMSSTISQSTYETTGDPLPPTTQVTWSSTTSGSGTSGWQPVPEPTSMALLALGVATLGLRRKNRK